MQAAHAVAEWGRVRPDPWHNGTMVLALTDDVCRWWSRLRRLGLTPVAFREPDLDLSTTAVAVAVPESRRRYLSWLKLC